MFSNICLLYYPKALILESKSCDLLSKSNYVYTLDNRWMQGSQWNQYALFCSLSKLMGYFGHVLKRHELMLLPTWRKILLLFISIITCILRFMTFSRSRTDMHPCTCMNDSEWTLIQYREMIDKNRHNWNESVRVHVFFPSDIASRVSVLRTVKLSLKSDSETRLKRLTPGTVDKVVDVVSTYPMKRKAFHILSLKHVLRSDSREFNLWKEVN